MTRAAPLRLKHTVLIVAALNIGWFGVEFAVARGVGSVALFADSIDFLEDASLNLLILVALGWTARGRARLGMALSALLLVPTVATLWTAWDKIAAPLAPAPGALTATAMGALAINLSCALLLAAHRNSSGGLTRAAFLSSRNDTLANIAIIVAGAVTAFVWHSAWPDVIVGIAIAVMNADAAREVWIAARAEGVTAARG